MHSGGDLKEGKYQYIYIEATIEEAEVIFENKFGHNPNSISCECCGEDYSINEEKESLEQSTGYDRGCSYNKETGLYEETPDRYKDYRTLEEFLKQEEVLVVYKTNRNTEKIL